MKKIYQNTEKKEYLTPKVKEYNLKSYNVILAGSDEADAPPEEGDPGNVTSKGIFIFDEE